MSDTPDHSLQLSVVLLSGFLAVTIATPIQAASNPPKRPRSKASNRGSLLKAQMQWLASRRGNPIPIFEKESLQGEALVRKKAAEAAMPNLLVFQSAVFDPVVEGVPDFSAYLPSSVTMRPGAKPNYYLVQFDSPITETERSALGQAGAGIISYVPNHAFLVAGDVALGGALGTLPRVRWHGAFQPGYKVETNLMRIAAHIDGEFPNAAKLRTGRSGIPGIPGVGNHLGP